VVVKTEPPYVQSKFWSVLSARDILRGVGVRLEYVNEGMSRCEGVPLRCEEWGGAFAEADRDLYRFRGWKVSGAFLITIT